MTLDPKRTVISIRAEKDKDFRVTAKDKITGLEAIAEAPNSEDAWKVATETLKRKLELWRDEHVR